MEEDDEAIQHDALEQESDETKEQRIERERHELLNSVLSGNITTLKERVGFILNRFSDSRNSDIELAWKFWGTFEAEKFSGHTVSKNEMFALTKMTSLARSRAKIQNEYKLFEADEDIRHYRGMLEEEHRQAAVDDKPMGLPSYTVFMDETGKTQDYLCVGSLWIVEDGLDSLRVNREINKWKEANSIDFEFHFAEVTRNRLQNYKDFFIKFISQNPTAGFKIIAVRHPGSKEMNQAITDLSFHLLNNGINHENETKRASLPRILQVWLDEDEAGRDKLKLENIKERIVAQNIKGLYLDNFHAVSSKSNYFIQAVDLFTASINRKINVVSGTPNQKDELAEFVLGVTNFDISSFDPENANADNAMVFNLSDFRVEE